MHYIVLLLLVGYVFAQTKLTTDQSTCIYHANFFFARKRKAKNEKHMNGSHILAQIIHEFRHTYFHHICEGE
jgi:hypothetical protein